MNIKVKKLREGAKLPHPNRGADAGAFLYRYASFNADHAAGGISAEYGR